VTTKPITTAVILAAGTGKRIKPVFDDKPKGFLIFGEKPIIEESVTHLYHHGIKKIIIVTGYKSEYYEDLACTFPALVTVYNDRFETSGSMYSLFCAGKNIHEDFLLLESDLVYEQQAIREIIRCPQKDAILTAGLSNSSDEVFIEAPENILIAMSKNRSELGSVNSELVGISKISYPLFVKMVQYMESRIPSNYHISYETDCLNSIAREHPIYCHCIKDLLWSEIDTNDHYLRVKNSIYPRIQHTNKGKAFHEYNEEHSS